MLNGFGFGTGMKAARVGDQIDAQVTALKALVSSTEMVAGQFNFVETQLQQFAQIVAQSGDQMAAMQFQNMQQQIDNIQNQIVNNLQQLKQGLANIDTFTDKIQN